MASVCPSQEASIYRIKKSKSQWCMRRLVKICEYPVKPLKRQYDENVKHHVYESGDLVWLHQPIRKVGLCPKLQRQWDGPFRVVNRLSDLVYRIQRVGKTRTQVVHHNRLKKYYGIPGADSLA